MREETDPPTEDRPTSPPTGDAAAQATPPGEADPGPPAGPPAPAADTGYTASGVPTLEGVREKIETRYGTALGHTELASETPEARDAADRYETRRQAAAERLEEIRESMREDDQSDG